jgi:hypothetical protein
MTKEYIFTEDYIYYEYYANNTLSFKKGQIAKAVIKVLNNKNFYFFDGSVTGFNDQDKIFGKIMLLEDFIELRNKKIEKIIEGEE